MVLAESVIPKTGYRHWVLFWYTAIVVICWNVVGLASFSLHPHVPPWYMFALLPVFLPAIFFTLNLFSFPFRYSCMGSLGRTPMPSVPPIAESRHTGGKIALMGGTRPFYSWFLFADGIGLTFHPGAHAFIPFSHVDFIKSTFLGGKCVYHHWREVRSAVIIPVGEVSKQLDAAFEAFANAKTL